MEYDKEADRAYAKVDDLKLKAGAVYKLTVTVSCMTAVRLKCVRGQSVSGGRNCLSLLWKRMTQSLF